LLRNRRTLRVCGKSSGRWRPPLDICTKHLGSPGALRATLRHWMRPCWPHRGMVLGLVCRLVLLLAFHLKCRNNTPASGHEACNHAQNQHYRNIGAKVRIYSHLSKNHRGNTVACAAGQALVSFTFIVLGLPYLSGRIRGLRAGLGRKRTSGLFGPLVDLLR